MHHWWIVWQLTQDSIRAREVEYERRRQRELSRLQGAIDRPPRTSPAWGLHMPRLRFTISLAPRGRQS